MKRPKFHLRSSRSNENTSRKEDEYYFLIEKDNSKGGVKTNIYIYYEMRTRERQLNISMTSTNMRKCMYCQVCYTHRRKDLRRLLLQEDVSKNINTQDWFI